MVVMAIGESRLCFAVQAELWAKTGCGGSGVARGSKYRRNSGTSSSLWEIVHCLAY